MPKIVMPCRGLLRIACPMLALSLTLSGCSAEPPVRPAEAKQINDGSNSKEREPLIMDADSSAAEPHDTESSNNDLITPPRNNEQRHRQADSRAPTPGETGDSPEALRLSLMQEVADLEHKVVRAREQKETRETSLEETWLQLRVISEINQSFCELLLRRQQTCLGLMPLIPQAASLQGSCIQNDKIAIENETLNVQIELAQLAQNESQSQRFQLIANRALQSQPILANSHVPITWTPVAGSSPSQTTPLYAEIQRLELVSLDGQLPTRSSVKVNISLRDLPILEDEDLSAWQAGAKRSHFDTLPFTSLLAQEGCSVTHAELNEIAKKTKDSILKRNVEERN